MNITSEIQESVKVKGLYDGVKSFDKSDNRCFIIKYFPVDKKYMVYIESNEDCDLKRIDM